MPTSTLQPPKIPSRWTYDQMADRLEETNLPTELWDGEIVRFVAPGPRHQTIVAHTWRRIDDHIRLRKLGAVLVSPIDVVLSGSKVVQPDVVFVSTPRESIVLKSCIRGAPDLLVEVISDGTWRRDRVDKKALYEQFGVSEYWIIDPESHLIEVFVLTSGTYHLHLRGIGPEKVSSTLLPGLKFSFEQLDA